ncbi:hypothetical protein C2869_14640 [Saccharobesus litoralis]|uniref:Uncharacterized protein n=1 Tax=Saccharobesus litoralis TaxID=2172099 RepID=A0A2S0VU30_9ALTE|nr:hypothetical protein [Saccharobesus litoralis]AWB67600.1 hypothetical protein C2869_14640 [Saccharobesus litoralis]
MITKFNKFVMTLNDNYEIPFATTMVFGVGFSVGLIWWGDAGDVISAITMWFTGVISFCTVLAVNTWRKQSNYTYKQKLFGEAVEHLVGIEHLVSDLLNKRMNNENINSLHTMQLIQKYHEFDIRFYSEFSQEAKSILDKEFQGNIMRHATKHIPAFITGLNAKTAGQSANDDFKNKYTHLSKINSYLLSGTETIKP